MNFLRKLDEMVLIADKMANELKNGQGSSMTSQIVAFIYDVHTAFSGWKTCGSKIFQLSDDLLEAFDHTDVPLRMTSGDFKYPFDSFVIESQSGRPLFSTKTPNGDLGVHTILYSDPKSITKKSGKEPYIVRMSDGKRLDSFLSDRMVYGFMPVEIGMERIRIDFDDKLSFEKISKTPRTNSLENPCDNDDMRNMINIFCNTVLYINDPTRIPAETQSTHTRKVIVKGGVKAKQEYILLKAPKNYIPMGRSHREGGELTCRFPVRGHWREQAHGEKHSLRKTMWILPFWKGPELAEVVSKPYHLK